MGGFSYGDHVAGGLVLATRIRAHLQADLSAFLADGGRVLGICNGFQTLTRLGLLPGPEAGPPDFLPRAALTNNDRLGYRDAWVRIGVDPRTRSIWTRGVTSCSTSRPATARGSSWSSRRRSCTGLEQRGQLAFRRIDAAGKPTEAWPENPNGSALGVAGLTDSTGRILGLMPHPDAFLYPWHHPDCARKRAELEGKEAAGLAIFRAGVEGA